METSEGRHQIKWPAESVLQRQRQPREIKERSANREVNEQVHVACGVLVATGERPEDAGMQHTVLAEDCDDAIPVGRPELARY
jgi:hypothetical protein